MIFEALDGAMICNTALQTGLWVWLARPLYLLDFCCTLPVGCVHLMLIQMVSSLWLLVIWLHLKTSVGGVGEVMRRVIAKAVLSIVKLDVLEAAGSLQPCAWQDTGNKAAFIMMIPQRLCCWLMPVMLSTRINKFPFIVFKLCVPCCQHSY